MQQTGVFLLPIPPLTAVVIIFNIPELAEFSEIGFIGRLACLHVHL